MTNKRVRNYGQTVTTLIRLNPGDNFIRDKSYGSLLRSRATVPYTNARQLIPVEEAFSYDNSDLSKTVFQIAGRFKLFRRWTADGRFHCPVRRVPRKVPKPGAYINE